MKQWLLFLQWLNFSTIIAETDDNTRLQYLNVPVAPGWTINKAKRVKVEGANELFLAV
jgi:hypothetical protein